MSLPLRRRSVLTALLLALALLITGLPAGLPAADAAVGVFVNELHYDNVSTDTGEFVEIAGPAGTDLSGWSIVLYNGSNGTAYNTRALSGAIPDEGAGFGAVAETYPTNGIQNGSPDGLALVNGTTVVQFLSYEGTFAAVGGPADGMASTDIGVSEPGDTAVGQSLQLTGEGQFYEDFTWTGPAAESPGQVNAGQSFGEVDNQPILMDCGDVDADEGEVASADISATDADGTVTTLKLDGVTDDPGTITFSDVSPATTVGGTATATLNVGADTPAGDYVATISAANDDEEPQSATCTVAISVLGIIPIGEVQGVVADDADGPSVDSPLLGETVRVQGVIYSKTLARTSRGGDSHGFFIQNTADTADDDPRTSDGIFVFMSRFTSLIGGYVPTVGDEVVLEGRVSEFFNLEQLTSATLVEVVRSGVDIDEAVPAFELDPPADLDEAGRYFERREGMRAQVPAGSSVNGGRDVFGSTLDGEVWLVHPDREILDREDPYAGRVFRDPHPLDNNPQQLFDDGNGYRFVIGSLGLKAAAGDNTVLVAPARTFDTVTNSPTGGVYFSFNKYQVQITEDLELERGVDPSENAPFDDFDRHKAFSTAVYNVENLYDFRDDPSDGCDFRGNSGCPGVRPPFDYAPASQGDYDQQLADLADQVVTDLHAPDILLVQEAEDQDICAVEGGELVCGSTDNADGKPDTLQDLALEIAELSGVAYDAALDRDGADDRGIVSGFLYRTDRVELLPADPDDAVLGAEPGVDYRGKPLAYNTDVQNPKVLNAVLPDDVDRSTGTDGSNVFTRPAQVAEFRVWRGEIGGSVFTDLYAISNHFSSGPDRRIGQRTEQAAYNAAIVEAIRAEDADANIVVGGDFNVFPRPDDPLRPSDEGFPSDQLAPLYEAGLFNVYDRMVEEVPAAAYSYVFNGQAQTLDSQFLTEGLVEVLEQTRAAHINADFPADFAGDGSRGASDHDPVAARFEAGPTIEQLREFVEWLVDDGSIRRQEHVLLETLDRAEQFAEEGETKEAENQLRVFTVQVRAFTPQFVDRDASEALVGEAELVDLE